MAQRIEKRRGATLSYSGQIALPRADYTASVILSDVALRGPLSNFGIFVSIAQATPSDTTSPNPLYNVRLHAPPPTTAGWPSRASGDAVDLVGSLRFVVNGTDAFDAETPIVVRVRS
jgi:hypothetical protein